MKKDILNQRAGYIKNTVLLTVAIVLLFILYSCTSTGSGNTSGLSLMDAIEQSAERIVGEIPNGSRVAIVAFESTNGSLSEYIMEELTGALFDRGIEVADRQNLEYVYRELELHMSGNVSDESAKSIGKFLGADMVIIGQLLDIGTIYRYRTNVIHVETAIRASVTRLDVRNDRDTQRMVSAISNQLTTVRTARYGVSVDHTPKTAGTFLDRGILFASRGEYEMAIADFNEALKLNPNLAAAYILKGRALVASVAKLSSIEDSFSSITILIQSGQVSEEYIRVYDQAIENFTHAIRLDPNFAGAYNIRGYAYQAKNDTDRAIADYNQAIRLDPNFALAYSNRGSVYFDMGDYDHAIDDYTQAIRLNPNNSYVYSNRGNAYNAKKDYDRAIADHNQAIRLDPNDSIAYINRGVVYYTLRNYAQAIADFETALKIEPNNTTAQSFLERARQARGR
jgi:tetratricopeptide (TPR) repeat protein